jgi:hypothetical protein
MMNYQQSLKGYKMKYTTESFEEVLQQAYDNLEPDDIVKLLLEAREYFRSDEFTNEFISNICSSVAKKRNISFKQWKAVSAYVAECKRKQQNINNKTF